MASVISTNNLTKYYGKTRGIENLNLTVEVRSNFRYMLCGCFLRIPALRYGNITGIDL
jgi:hypothetical protein